MTTSMSTRPPQPPAKQFILRQRASDKELLELYFRQDQIVASYNAARDRLDALAKKAKAELDASSEGLKTLRGEIDRAKEQIKIPVVAVMNPAKNEKSLYWPEDTAFENPIETVQMKPEDYELPLL